MTFTVIDTKTGKEIAPEDESIIALLDSLYESMRKVGSKVYAYPKYFVLTQNGDLLCEYIERTHLPTYTRELQREIHMPESYEVKIVY